MHLLILIPATCFKQAEKNHLLPNWVTWHRVSFMTGYEKILGLGLFEATTTEEKSEVKESNNYIVFLEKYK